MATILVVEDNSDIRENLAEILRLSGHDVHEACDGSQALQSAFDYPVNLILSDIRMPRMDGWELLSRLRQDGRTAHIPVIFITARADVESTDQAHDMGASGYLIKPFTNNQLLDIIAEFA